MTYTSTVHGAFQLVEIKEKGLMVLNEIFVDSKGDKKPGRFCFLKTDMLDMNEVLGDKTSKEEAKK